MTDPDLAHRAEQAYLGALLARQGRPGTGTAVAGDAGPGGFAGLSPQDFADPVHRAIYAALAGQTAARPRGVAGLYERLRGLLSRLLGAQARDAAAYMATLPGMCPDPANLPAYAAMVTEASQAPAAAAPAPAYEPQRPAAENARLASAGQWLDDPGPGRRQAGTRQAAPAYEVPPSGAGRTPDGLDRDTARLARALAAGARSATRGAPEAARPPARRGNQPAPLDASALEEQVLADLMRRPASGREVTSWLPSTVFSATANRALYRLISVRLADGRPVDPLIIAWDASMLAGAAGTAGTPGTAEGQSLAAAALRLGALDPAVGTAAALGQALYAEQVCKDTFGPGWRTEPRRNPPQPAAPALPGEPSQAPGPAAAANAAAPAHQPAQAAARPASAASRTEPAPAAPSRPVPPPPRLASGLPLRRPPLPGPAEPGSAQRI